MSRPTRFHAEFVFVYGAITLYRRTFQTVPLTHSTLRAAPRSLAATEESRLISFPRGTEMFHFSRFASQHYVFMLRYCINAVGFPIRTLWCQCFLPARPHFSQVSTSFIASDCLGIHRVRLVT